MGAKFSPSLMCMDLTQFKEQITAMNNKADFYHVDIMDGNYVRNITLSPFFIENLKKITTVPIDVHLMVNHPEDIIGFVNGMVDSHLLCHSGTINRHSLNGALLS
ncbi:D-allulose-6-phosphate 3-epimerase [Klebsiella quasipneumoniae subsp. quasipneumoniae]|nr:hypothetical protein [Klebsiella quasipneumoniae]VGP11838.1 D-allulose-6-phosphate 3-epimerase [Klebsiella quasipneumoniae subsp. quasipneumoniae]